MLETLAGRLENAALPLLNIITPQHSSNARAATVPVHCLRESKEVIMDLLAKFESVEIKADTRISDKDRIFCEAHQAAYDSARNALLELEFFWDDMQEQQKKFLTPIKISPNTYLTQSKGLKLSNNDIMLQIHSLHPTFIHQLISYFSGTYHFFIDVNDVIKHLIPQEPANKQAEDYKIQAKKYRQDFQNLTLNYRDILEQIFFQIEGHALSEQAIYELKGKCHRAVWHSTDGHPMFECKKSVIQLTFYACSFVSGRTQDTWKLMDKTKDILMGISHFEAGGFDSAPKSLSEISKRGECISNVYEFYDCEKIQSLRMFKNGRADLKFTSEAYASQFIEDYMKTIC